MTASSILRFQAAFHAPAICTAITLKPNAAVTMAAQAMNRSVGRQLSRTATLSVDLSNHPANSGTPNRTASSM